MPDASSSTGAAAVLRERAVGLAGEALRGARRQLEALRRADRFARTRLAIVGAWTALSLVTLWAACGVAGGNGLGAEVQLAEGSIMGAQLFVRNDSARRWENVVLTLDGEYVHLLPVLVASDHVVLPVAEFQKHDAPPPRGYRPRALTIACAQGSHRFELR